MNKLARFVLVFLLAFLILCSPFVFFHSSSAVASGEEAPYDIVSQNVTFTSRHDVELAGTLFYPASYCVEEGEEFPGIVIAEGAIATKEMYYWLAEALACEGYVVLTFDYTGQGKSATEIIPGVPWPALTNVFDIFGAECEVFLDVWMHDTQDAITYLIEDSPISCMVDEVNIGLTGHSCGGCATVVVTARDDRVKAASALAPFDFIEPIIPRASDYAAEMAAANPRPIQVQVGNLDLICPYWTMAYPIYNNSVAPRQIIAIANVEHLGYTDTRYLPWLFGAEPGCHEAAEHYTLAWFDYYLKGEPGAYCRITTQLPMIAHMEYDLVGSEECDSWPAPTVLSIAPASGLADSVVGVTNLDGANFRAGATVRLEQDGTVIDAHDINVIPSSTITCKFDLSGAPVGAYDVVVTNPDGQEASLEDGFEVTAACGEGSGTAILMLGVMLGLLSLAGSSRLHSRRRRKRAKE